MSDIIYANEVNLLRDFIHNEVQRFGLTPSPAYDINVGDIVDDAWWEIIRANLQTIIDTSGLEACAGNVITKAQRDGLINKASEAYKRTISVV
jgi:hypothetical protein